MEKEVRIRNFHWFLWYDYRLILHVKVIRCILSYDSIKFIIKYLLKNHSLEVRYKKLIQDLIFTSCWEKKHDDNLLSLDALMWLHRGCIKYTMLVDIIMKVVVVDKRVVTKLMVNIYTCRNNFSIFANVYYTMYKRWGFFFIDVSAV